MNQPPVDPTLSNYIAANRERFTREAITAQLVDAGHDPAAIEAAWATVTHAPPSADGSFFTVFNRIVFGLGLILALLGGAAIFGLSDGAALWLLIPYLLAYTLLGMGAIWLFRRIDRRLHFAGFGAALAASAMIVVFAGLVFGTCVATGVIYEAVR